MGGDALLLCVGGGGGAFSRFGVVVPSRPPVQVVVPFFLFR